MCSGKHDLPKWRELISISSLTLLWNFIVAIGGFALFTFVISNGFLPELDLTGALSLLVSVSLVSLSLVFSLFLLTTAGGLTMYIWFRDSDAGLRGKITYLAAGISSCLICILLAYFSEKSSWIRNILVGSGLFIILILFAVAYFRIIRLTWQPSQRRRQWGMLGTAVAIGAMLSANHAAVFMRLYRTPSQYSSDWLPWLSVIAWLFIQALLMGIVASRSTSKEILKVTIPSGAMVFIVLLALSNNPAFLVNRMAQMLGIGALHDVRLVVTRTGCEILNVASKGDLCFPTPRKSTYLVEPITLRSRFGKQILIEHVKTVMSSGQDDQLVLTVVLPSIEVLGWQQENKIGEKSSQTND